MRKFYFVGGLKLEQSEEFLRCPGVVGRKAAAWCIYPPGSSDGKLEPQGVVWNRLLHFDGASQWSQIVEIAERVQ